MKTARKWFGVRLLLWTTGCSGGLSGNTDSSNPNAQLSEQEKQAMFCVASHGFEGTGTGLAYEPGEFVREGRGRADYGREEHLPGWGTAALPEDEIRLVFDYLQAEG